MYSTEVINYINDECKWGQMALLQNIIIIIQLYLDASCYITMGPFLSKEGSNYFNTYLCIRNYILNTAKWYEENMMET